MNARKIMEADLNRHNISVTRYFELMCNNILEIIDTVNKIVKSENMNISRQVRPFCSIQDIIDLKEAFKLLVTGKYIVIRLMDIEDIQRYVRMMKIGPLVPDIDKTIETVKKYIRHNKEYLQNMILFNTNKK